MQLHEFVAFHKNKNKTDGLRLGQRFVNTYMRRNLELASDESFRPWNQTDLFNEASGAIALATIQVWLLENNYFCGDLPFAKMSDL